MTPTTSRPSCALSLKQVKELISFAQSKRVVVLELDGLRFQFAPVAFEQTAEHEAPKKKKPDEEVSPFGHHKPE